MFLIQVFYYTISVMDITEKIYPVCSSVCYVLKPDLDACCI